MKILIIEDEWPAYKKLVTHLSDFFDEDLTLDHSRTVKDGIAFLQASQIYDLILSDIKLVDGNSFQIFQEVDTQTPIIFCTAYDEHLLEAFRTNGIAYIMKPYFKQDLEHALRKFQNLFREQVLEKDVFRKLKEVLDSNKYSYKKRLAIKKGNGIKLLDTSDITFIQANGDFCRIIDSSSKLHSTSKSIGVLIEELNPKQFFRINRSQIVNVDFISNIEPYSKNRLSLKIEGVTERAMTSSSTTKYFRQWLED